MDDSVDLQPGSSNDAEISPEIIDSPAAIDNDPTDPNKSSGDKVFDISEDTIAEVKDVPMNSMQVFPIKKVVPKIPSTTNPPKASPVPVAPTPKQVEGTSWPVAENKKEIPPTTPEANPTPSKNLFDTSYVKPRDEMGKPESFIPTLENTPTLNNTSKFAAEKLPEIPAFKGTFDQKATSSFEPQSFTESNKIESVPTTNSTVTPPKPSTPPINPTPTNTLTDNKPESRAPINPAPIAEKNLINNEIKPSTEAPKERAIGSIPLKDITVPKSPTRNTPSNPPTKVLGAIPPQNNENKFDLPEDPSIKKLRTYESDVAEIMSHRNISAASIAIAEKKRNEQIIYPNNNDETSQQEEPQAQKNTSTSHSTSKFFLILISFVFIVVGIGGAYYFYKKSIFGSGSTVLTVNPTPTNNSIITTDSKATLNISGMDPNAIVASIKNEFQKDQKPNSIKEIVINDGQNKVAAPRMIDFMDIDAPDILKRSLTNDWILGVNNDSANNKDIFVIAQTNFFQNAFAGMFQWESVMADDLKLFLSNGAYQGIVNAPKATSTITVKGPIINVTVTDNSVSEGNTESYSTLRGQFEDYTIMNKDVRVFKTKEGKILFFYSFINNSTIVVASKEQTLVEILNRLENKAFVR